MKPDAVEIDSTDDPNILAEYDFLGLCRGRAVAFPPVGLDDAS